MWAEKCRYCGSKRLSFRVATINHTMLLNKINHRGKVRRQIKSWLKAGVVDGGTFSKTLEGTPQGGVLSPFLANIALHGISKMLEDFIENTTIRDEKPPYRTYSKGRRIQSLTYIRYADDFVVIHKDIGVIQKCRELISKWLSDIGLELKPAKTRIAHTLIPEQSEDGKAGFNFLGYHIRQFPVSRHKSARNGHKQILGFYTLITPSKEAVKRHQRKLKDVIKDYKNSSQIKLINELNPVIRGWINYYQFSDATTVGEFCKQDHILHHKLRAWGRRRTGNLRQAYQKYWNTIGKRNWVFSFKDGDNLHQLISHTKYGSSSNNYVKVKNEESPYNGNLIYWSTRLGRNPDMPMRKAILLKKQKGICQWCSLHFQEEDILETDHIIPKALNGKDTYDNLQLLHGHCHDEKTALDMKFIRNQRFQKYLEYINQELNKHQPFQGVVNHPKL